MNVWKHAKALFGGMFIWNIYIRKEDLKSLNYASILSKKQKIINVYQSWNQSNRKPKSNREKSMKLKAVSVRTISWESFSQIDKYLDAKIDDPWFLEKKRHTG